MAWDFTLHLRGPAGTRDVLVGAGDRHMLFLAALAISMESPTFALSLAAFIVDRAISPSSDW